MTYASNPSIDGQDPINAALVPPLKRSGNVRHTLTALPALPESALCFGVNRVRAFPSITTPPHLARLEGVAAIG